VQWSRGLNLEIAVDSVLELSDEAILAEIIETGADPREEAERLAPSELQARRD